MLFEGAWETSDFRSIKYVITLDTDTQLPRESARQLIGTMAHPLNQPQFDPAREIVTEGYGTDATARGNEPAEREPLMIR